MGALPIIGDIASGVGALTGIYSAAEGASYNAQALALQQQENEKNRQFQSQEAEKERAFAQTQTNQLLEYNSAPAQVQRLRQAGLNPATAFSHGAGSAGSAMSPTRGAVPVGSSGLSIPQFISPMAEISASGAYLKSLADAYKASEEGSKARDLLQSEIEKNMADRNLKELQVEGQNTANMIAAKTGMRKSEAEIKYILNDADLKIALAAESIAKKGLTEAETNRQIEQLTGDVYDNVYKRFNALLGKKRFQMAEIDLRYHEAEVREGIKTLQSQQSKNYAEGKYASEMATTESDFRSIRKTLLGDDHRAKVQTIRNLAIEGKEKIINVIWKLLEGDNHSMAGSVIHWVRQLNGYEKIADEVEKYFKDEGISFK